MKILFKILDYLISVFMGTVTLFLVTFVINESWNMFIAMIIGMIIGTAVLLISVLLFSSVSTPFELFPAGMIITMFTGMAAGMARVMDADFQVMLIPAVIFSSFTQLMMDLYNMRLKGKVNSVR
jgi:hypothetical protein